MFLFYLIFYIKILQSGSTFAQTFTTSFMMSSNLSSTTCLHYGQEAFEGLKAYRGKDGKIRIFRPEANAERLQSTCDGIPVSYTHLMASCR